MAVESAALRQAPHSAVRLGTILFCREVPWQTELPVSTRKLAEHFAAAGWRVIWVEPPRAVWRDVESALRGTVRHVQADGCHENVTPLAPRTLLPFSMRIPGVWRALAERSWAGCVPSIGASLRRGGLSSPDVLWLSHVSALGLPALFPAAPVLWQVTDDYPLLSRTEHRCRELLAANLARADAVLFSSPLLLERYRSLCRRVRFEPSVLPHGVDAWRLHAEPFGPDLLPPAEGPRLVYVGNTRRADVELLCGLARSLDVVVIGDPAPFLGRSGSGARLHLLGPRRPEDVGRILAACDYGIVCYSAQHLRAAAEGGNPMKAYEYAAAGLPILAPQLPVFSRLGVPVHYYDGLGSLLAAVRHLASLPRERDRMRAWAAEHTWEKRFSVVEQMVCRLLDSGGA
jgi:glycosyltransferase involved in cell wall biosynthesis